MRHAPSAGVAVLALALGGHAFAACPDDINKLRADLQKNASLQQRCTAGETPERRTAPPERAPAAPPSQPADRAPDTRPRQ